MLCSIRAETSQRSYIVVNGFSVSKQKATEERRQTNQMSIIAWVCIPAMIIGEDDQLSMSVHAYHRVRFVP